MVRAAPPLVLAPTAPPPVLPPPLVPVLPAPPLLNTAREDFERCTSAVALMLGNSAAPAIRACASASTIRATAAAISRLAASACSIRSLSSADRKPRHHSSGGTAACEPRWGAR